WDGGSTNAIGSPTAWSSRLATLFAIDVLRAADATAHSESIRRADEWLRGALPRNVHEAAIALLRLARETDDGAQAHVERAFEILRDGRHASGGWGPYATSAPQAFDTALVLLALAPYRRGTSPDGNEARDPVEAGSIDRAGAPRDANDEDDANDEKRDGR